MRNHIPRIKTLKYTKTREGVHTDSGCSALYARGVSEQEDTDDGRNTLIKSDNPKWRYEVYRFIDGGFLGYMAEIKREESISKLEDVE